MRGTDKICKYLIIGLIGSIVTVVGEWMQGYAPSTDLSSEMTRLFSAIATLPAWKIGMGSTLGAIGILMQFYGYYAVYLCLDNKESRLARAYKVGVYSFSIIGAIVHVLMSVMMYVHVITHNTPSAAERMMEYTIWFVMPIVAIFYVLYFAMCISMFILFIKRHTPFPKAYALLNPLTGKLVFSILQRMLVASALSNGIGNANMGISSIIILGVLLYSYRVRGCFSVMSHEEILP